MSKIQEKGGVMEMDELYTIDEIMAKLKVSRQTVYRHMDSGVLPFVQLGGQRRFIGKQVMDALKRMQASQSVDNLRAGSNVSKY